MPPTRFGTVRPRVQIPGPRPKSEHDRGSAAYSNRAPYHGRITISQIATKIEALRRSVSERLAVHLVGVPIGADHVPHRLETLAACVAALGSVRCSPKWAAVRGAASRAPEH